MEIKKGSLSYILLTILEKSVDGFVRTNDLINNPGYYAYWDGWDYPLNKSVLSKAIARLKEKGFVEQDKIDDNKIIVKLTDEGKIALILVEEGPKEWDGKWRIVVFDIPEQKRLIRNMFRRNLKKWGFKQLQKSVWISKKDVTDKLFSYIKDLEIEKWVMVFESEKYGPMDIT